MVRNGNGKGSKGLMGGTSPTLTTIQAVNATRWVIMTGPLAAFAAIQSPSRSAPDRAWRVACSHRLISRTFSSSAVGELLTARLRGAGAAAALLFTSGL